jgi:hypothetical protein
MDISVCKEYFTEKVKENYPNEDPRFDGVIQQVLEKLQKIDIRNSEDVAEIMALKHCLLDNIPAKDYEKADSMLRKFIISCQKV